MSLVTDLLSFKNILLHVLFISGKSKRKYAYPEHVLRPRLIRKQCQSEFRVVDDFIMGIILECSTQTVNITIVAKESFTFLVRVTIRNWGQCMSKKREASTLTWFQVEFLTLLTGSHYFLLTGSHNFLLTGSHYFQHIKNYCLYYYIYYYW